MKNKYFWIAYCFIDWCTAFLAWFLFNYFRKYYIEEYPFEINNKLIIDSLAIASLWVLLYFIFVLIIHLSLFARSLITELI